VADEVGVEEEDEEGEEEKEEMIRTPSRKGGVRGGEDKSSGPASISVYCRGLGGGGGRGEAGTAGLKLLFFSFLHSFIAFPSAFPFIISHLSVPFVYGMLLFSLLHFLIVFLLHNLTEIIDEKTACGSK
jgi:hypothetical protein